MTDTNPVTDDHQPYKLASRFDPASIGSKFKAQSAGLRFSTVNGEGSKFGETRQSTGHGREVVETQVHRRHLG